MLRQETVSKIVAKLESIDEEALSGLLKLLERIPNYALPPEPMDAETKAWLEADLGPPLEPYDWGGEDPETLGEPLRYEPGRGLVVLENGE